jgi:glutathione S-transferase
MGLVFHYTPMTSATRVHWALEELGVPYEKVKVDLSAGEQRKPEYLALNPNGKVPLLVADGEPIFESLAIVIHLGETHGVEKGLWPAPGPLRARTLKWLAWAQVTLGEAVARLLRNTSDRFPAEERNEKAAARARADIQDLLGMIEREALAGGDYVLGSEFTFVDLGLVGFLPFLARLGTDFGPFPKIQAWMGRCMARPALARAMQG